MGRCEGEGEGGSGGGLARLVAFLSLFTQPFLVTRGREPAALGSRWLLTLCTTTGPFVEELHEELIYTYESRDRLLRADRDKSKGETNAPSFHISLQRTNKKKCETII